MPNNIVTTLKDYNSTIDEFQKYFLQDHCTTKYNQLLDAYYQRKLIDSKCPENTIHHSINDFIDNKVANYDMQKEDFNECQEILEKLYTNYVKKENIDQELLNDKKLYTIPLKKEGTSISINLPQIIGFSPSLDENEKYNNIQTMYFDKNRTHSYYDKLRNMLRPYNKALISDDNYIKNFNVLDKTLKTISSTDIVQKVSSTIEKYFIDAIQNVSIDNLRIDLFNTMQPLDNALLTIRDKLDIKSQPISTLGSGI